MREISLTQGKVALVDDDDFERLNQFKWTAFKTGRHRELWYAVCGKYTRGARSSRLLMHREILNSETRLRIDHRNGDGLDNRRENLRACTHAQNQHNQQKQSRSSQPYKGIHYDRRPKGEKKNRRKSWYAHIHCEGKIFHIGSFPDPISAAVAYDIAAILLFGEFARLNFPGCYD